MFLFIYLAWNSNIFLVGGLEHFIFFQILGIIIPIDFHIFQRGRSTTNQIGKSHEKQKKELKSVKIPASPLEYNPYRHLKFNILALVGQLPRT